MHSAKNFRERSKEIAALGLSTAMLATLGGVAAKANASVDKIDEANTPALNSGATPEDSHLQSDMAAEVSPEKFAQHVLDSINNGPANMNIIDVGGLRLVAGTKIYDAPMKGAVDHVVPRGKYDFWYFTRLWQAPDHTLWAGATGVRSHTSPVPPYSAAVNAKLYKWVNISEASKLHGFEHVTPMAPLSKIVKTGGKMIPWDLPPTYSVTTSDSLFRTLVINEAFPPELLFPNGGSTTVEQRLAIRVENLPVSQMRKNGWEVSYDNVFIPTNRPVKFIKGHPVDLAAGGG